MLKAMRRFCVRLAPGLAAVFSAGLTCIACGGGGAKAPEPVRLHFSVQPSTALVDEPMDRAVQVVIQDAEGSTIPSATAAVEMSLEANPAGATLGGTLTVTAQDGIATFPDLTIDAPGQGFTLKATSGSLTAGTSQAFDVLTSLQQIVAIDLDDSTLVIEGDATFYSATLLNHAAEPVADVVIQGNIVQGDTWRAGGGRVVACSEPGVFSPGTCEVLQSLSAWNGGSGEGTLVPGAATAVIDIKTGFDNVLDTASIPVWLTASADQQITDVSLSDTTLIIEGTPISYTVTLFNDTDSPVSSLVLNAFTEQGEARRAAGGSMTRCGDPGEMPVGDCTFSLNFGVTNQSAGSGTLVPGDAIAVFELTEASVGLLDRLTLPITLTD